MIIVRERNITIKNQTEAIAAFRKMEDIFSAISSDLCELSIAFFNENWSLKESWQMTLTVYREKVKKIRERLTNLEALNAGLQRFLVNETRPILIREDVTGAFDIQTETIEKQIKWYYNAIKGTAFPDLDVEIQRHRNIVAMINANIDLINTINLPYRRPQVAHIKNLNI